MSLYPALSGSLDDDRLTFRFVPVQDLRDVWPMLQYGLNVVRESNGEPWINEDVYAALLHGQAGLYVFEDADGGVEGFGIFQVLNFPFEFKPRLNIWIGWAAHKRQGHLGEQVAKMVARAMGIESIVFSTTQQTGWVEKHHRLFSWYEVKDDGRRRDS